MSEDICTIIYGLETSLLRPETRASTKDLDRFLADGFMEFGSSGRVYKKSDILKRLPGSAAVSTDEFTVTDFEVRELAEGVMLATYSARRSQPGSKPMISLRSSIWKLTDCAWRMIFHQGTPFR